MKTNEQILRDAMADIINPIAAMQRDLPDGHSLNGGMAIHMANNPEHYKRIARAALAATEAPQPDVSADLEWHKTALARHAEKLKAVWKNLADMIAKHTGKPCSSEPLEDLAAIFAAAAPESAEPSAGAMSFVDNVIDVAFDGGCLDGGDIQEWAETHGLIKLERVTEPCGDDCRCAEVDAFPLDCYRKTYRLATSSAAKGASDA